MSFVLTVFVLLSVAVVVLWRLGARRKEGFNIIVISICSFAAGFMIVGGAIMKIPGVDEYLVRRGLIETPVEDAIYLVPASILGIACFWWMIRKV